MLSDGRDYIDGQGGNDIVYAGEGQDTVYGGFGSDRIYGDGGNDLLIGQQGNDAIVGGDGRDRMYGDSGRDQMWGNQGNDYMVGGDGDDFLDGGDGADTMSGGNNNDRLQGGNSGDIMYGDNGNDSVSGGSGNDRMYGGPGTDYLNGDAGDDSIYGGTGSDRLYGHSGHDWLYGEAGNDTLRGGDGDDVLSGGRGIESMKAGNGRNFFLNAGSRPWLRLGDDFINTCDQHLRAKYGARLGAFKTAIRAAFNGPERRGVVIMGHKFNVKPFTVARYGNRTEIKGQFSHSKAGPDDQFYYTLKFVNGKLVDIDTNVREGGMGGIVRTVQDLRSAWMQFSGIVTPWSFSPLTFGLEFPELNPANRVGLPHSESSNGTDLLQSRSNDGGWKAAAELLVRSIGALAYVGN